MCDMDQLSLNSVWIHKDKTPVNTPVIPLSALPIKDFYGFSFGLLDFSLLAVNQ